MTTQANRQMIPSAVHADALRPRDHDELPDPLRTPFELDRHRVLQSAAFRRLEYKTQVFVTQEHDHFRTRLTHTLEVAQVCRYLARALDINETLAETIALVHDLGHPPFGHAGEMALAELMESNGGFEHNRQALRVVEYLEHPYPPFRGLNLTFEVRESIAKHITIYDRPTGEAVNAAFFETGRSAPLEGQVACIADRIAYDCHDLEDALGAGLLSEQDLKDTSLWAGAAEPVRRQYPDLPIAAIRRPILDGMQAALLADAINQTVQGLGRTSVGSPDDVRRQDTSLVDFSPEMQAEVEALERFLHDRLYHHHRLVRMDDKAGRFIRRLFETYLEKPTLLPPRFTARMKEQGRHRVICDYIAGMTDRFCQDEYRKLFEPFERV